MIVHEGVERGNIFNTRPAFAGLKDAEIAEFTLEGGELIDD